MTTQPTSPPGLKGRRVLAMGQALKGLSQGPLKGARLELAGLERLVGVGSADADLVIIDADAWDAPELAAGIQALTLCSAAPPVLLVGTQLPTSVVRNLLRLVFYLSPSLYSVAQLKAFTERSRIMDAIFSLNPFTPLLESYRNVIYYQQSPEWTGLGVLLAISVVLLLGGLIFFKRSEPSFAKVL